MMSIVNERSLSRVTTCLALCVAGSMLSTAAAWSAEAVDRATPGQLIVEPSTLICLGFEWRLAGDENRNASVGAVYRKKGDGPWRPSLPLYRVGQTPDPKKWTIPAACVGSILDLEPDTEYEVKLTMQDPDGVVGEATRNLTARTRAEPKPFQGGRVRHVYPPDWKGERKEPAYKSIVHAVEGYHPWCDCFSFTEDHAQPGDTILVHSGYYRYERFDYRSNNLLWMHGTNWLTFSGEPGKPIAIMAAGDGPVTLDGDGSYNLFNVMAASYIHFEGLTFMNTHVAILAGLTRIGGCKGLTVKSCRFENVGNGVLAYDGRCEGFYIADNLFLGSNDAGQFHSTAGRASGRSRAGYAVNLMGRGHVVCYNRVERFWDGINVNTNGKPNPADGMQCLAIDIYNNHIENICDNFIETDGGIYNIRVLRNRCFNCLATPFSYQPVFAGPVYFIRNVVWNAAWGKEAFKACFAQVAILLHNTFSCHWSAYEDTDWADVRNNLFMGPAVPLVKGDDTRPVLKTGFHDPRSVFDYNGHRIGLRGAAKPFQLRLGKTSYAATSLAELAKLCGAEAHGLELADYSVFVAAEEPDHTRDRKVLTGADAADLRPRAGSPIVDAGCLIPGVNDDFTGKAPDLGAYEAGRPVSHYGPRTQVPEGVVIREAAAATLAATPAPADPGRPVIRVNCAAPFPYTDPYGRRWEPDQAWSPDRRWGYADDGASGIALRVQAIAGTVFQEVYRRERYGLKGYRFAVDNGRYLVRFHWAETYEDAAGTRVFTVQIEGKPAFADLDIWKEAGGKNRALVREAEVEVHDGELTIGLAPVRANPILNGIEIFRKP